MNRLNALGLGLVVVGAILAPFCYLVIYSIPLTVLGIALAIIGIVMLLTPQHLIPHQVVKALIIGSINNIEAILEEFNASHKAIYLSPKEGRIYAYVPLLVNPTLPTSIEIEKARRRVITYVNESPGLIIYPQGSEVVKLAGLSEISDPESALYNIESNLSYVLLDFTELVSGVRANILKAQFIEPDKEIEPDKKSETESKKALKSARINLELKGVKIQSETPRFTRVLGSLPLSLAACVVAAAMQKPVKILNESRQKRKITALLEVGE